MSSSYRLTLDRWLADLDVQANHCLDIGGSQLPVKGRTKTWAVNEYLIADLPNPHVDSPKPDIKLDLNKGLAWNWDEYQTETSGWADLIFCLEVFDYIYDPMTAFKNIFNLLTDGGAAWVSFPSFYPTHNPIEDDALCYKEFGIKKLAYANDLSVAQMIKRRPETDAIEQLWRRERMRAAKNYDHNFTGWICEFVK